jgi:hypothetical protein
MLTFTKWLTEAAFKFQKGRDQDYTNDPYEVLVFSEEAPENYEVEGKTHGQMSHAIKHLKEFEPDFVKGVVSKVKATLKKKLQEKPHWFCKVWNNMRGFEKKSGVDAIDSASQDAVLNTLDLINDKNQMKEGLLKLDSSIKPFAVELEHKYNELISHKLDKAVDLNKLTLKGSAFVKKMKKSQIVQFDCKGTSGGNFSVVIDFSDQSLIIGKRDDKDMSVVNTMYRFNNTGTGKSAVVDAFFKKRLIPSNPEIKVALENL